MNKEYMHISNNEIVVTDENWHLTKRDLEYRLEEVNKFIDKFEYKISDCNSKKGHKLKKAGFIASCSILVFTGCLIGHVVNPTFSINTGLYITTINTIAFTYYFIGQSIINTSTINEAKKELEIAYTIRNNLQKELIETREKTKTENNNLQSENKTNEPITIKENSSYMGELYRQLDEAYVNGYNQKNDKPKQLVLTHSKKQK